jgi:hypothetical protein
MTHAYLTEPAIRESGKAFITGEVMPFANSLSDAFFTSDQHGRKAIIMQETKPGFFQRFALEAFGSGSYAVLASRFYEAARFLGHCPLIVVQTAVFLEAGERTALHAQLHRSYPEAFIRFQVYPDLAGGMRIFVDGKLVDMSWRGRLRQIMSRITKPNYV